MRLTPLEKKLFNYAEPVIADLGFRTVLIKSIGADGSLTIQIMAEDATTGNLGVDDCAKISRAVSAIFDVEDPINGAYRLEVSSPGIDRPLITIEDYIKYKDFEVKIEIDIPLENGQKRFRGYIKGTNEDSIIIETDTEEFEIEISSITKSKLVLTDKLIKESAKKQK